MSMRHAASVRHIVIPNGVRGPSVKAGMKTIVLILAAAEVCPAQVRIVFVPESDQFADAAREYRELWAKEGAKITAAVEEMTGLKFEDREVKAMVLEIS